MGQRKVACDSSAGQGGREEMGKSAVMIPESAYMVVPNMNSGVGRGSVNVDLDIEGHERMQID